MYKCLSIKIPKMLQVCSNYLTVVSKSLFPMEKETRQLSDIRDYFPISYNLNFLSRNVLYSFFFVLAKINLLHYSLKFLFNFFFFFFNSEHKKTSSLSDFVFFGTLKLTNENKKILLPPTFAKN